MRVANILELEEGMTVVEPVTAADGQLIADAGVVLTHNLITQITSLGILSVKVEDPPDDFVPEPEPAPAVQSEPVHDPGGNVKNPTYSQRIKSSPTFQNFQIGYTKSSTDLKDALAPIINGTGTLDKEVLKQIASPLIHGVHTSIEMFDMLHNMRSVNDSIYAHAMNVALIARILGKWAKLSPEDLELLVLTGLLHDVGKAKIPDEILNKPGKYTDEEFELVKSHTTMSYEILSAIPDDVLDPRVKTAALQHHERRDGSGYPNGLKGDEISEFAMIIAIADVYDAMTAARSYRAPLCPFQVIAAFEQEGIQKYHPKYILTFLERIANAYQNNRILLNDGRAGDIILLNKQYLSRPVVKLNDGSCIDLSREPELCIQSLL